MGLDIYFEATNKKDLNKKERNSLLKKIEKTEEILNSRGSEYHRIFKLTKEVESLKKIIKLNNVRKECGDKNVDSRNKYYIETLEKDEQILSAKENKGYIEQIKLDEPIVTSYKKDICRLKEITPFEEVSYFRKVYFILDFFDYTENCSDMKLTKDKVQKLKIACKKAAKNHNMASVFLNVNQLDEREYNMIPYVAAEMDRILKTFDWKNKNLILHCWW